jgi:hypothetical protein
VSIKPCPLAGGDPVLDVDILDGAICEATEAVGDGNEEGITTLGEDEEEEAPSVWLVKGENALPMKVLGGGKFSAQLDWESFFFNFSSPSLYGQVPDQATRSAYSFMGSQRATHLKFILLFSQPIDYAFEDNTPLDTWITPEDEGPPIQPTSGTFCRGLSCKRCRSLRAPLRLSLAS